MYWHIATVRIGPSIKEGKNTMIRMILAFLALSMGTVAMAQQTPTQPAVPLQWNITVPTSTNLTTATYPGNVIVKGVEQYQTYTVATLPTCNAAAAGSNAAVTDATAPSYNGALTGGGAVGVPVYCNGTSWTAH